ncbi:hypothetical protein [Streptomyces sp. NPDC002521]
MSGRPDEALYPGRSISNETASGLTTLTMQDNGDLVLQASDGRVCWHSKTTTGFYPIYRSDDNFVIYDQGNHPVWASGTQGDGGDTTNVNMYGQVWVGEDVFTGGYRWPCVKVPAFTAGMKPISGLL